MLNGTWKILKVSDWEYCDTREVSNPAVLLAILMELQETFKEKVIINMERKTLTIYDDYIE